MTRRQDETAARLDLTYDGPRPEARAGRGAPADPGRAGRGGLIVPRGSGLSAEALCRRLSASRRRAQEAARAALGAG